jgi:hypothetical protein
MIICNFCCLTGCELTACLENRFSPPHSWGLEVEYRRFSAVFFLWCHRNGRTCFSSSTFSETLFLSCFFSLLFACYKLLPRMVQEGLYSVNVCLMMWHSPFHLSYHLCSIRTTNHVLLLTNRVGFETGFVVKMLVFYIFAKITSQTEQRT